MASENPLPDYSDTKNGNFKCGVVEGFYGRPWTTEQRKDLFAKLKKWGMNCYLYAPKDDYKHRAYWRELYTVEEAEHLTSLITAAKDHGITFYYAISPGLDITYSSVKEVTALKRKLEQVSQFGCNAFALLFDDIEPEMSEVDKEVFQSFAHAQVSVTNEMYQHLGQPTFIICPTQYCAARATPNVAHSEYLNTLGAKLPSDVDIMWTGSKVISRTLTPESIEEITEVLRRPPVIWDNIHANDYDQKRIYLGPYSGRSPDLIPKLRGVLTNPNCEYGANFVAIHTLAQWSRCNVDAIRETSINDPVSADIKLETEGGSEDGPCGLSPNMYHPRRALKNAIEEWLAEFNKNKPAWGPIAKPQQVISTPVPIPIIPSINTCMSVTSATTTTTTTTSVPLPGVNGSQLHALAEVCCTVSTSVMNSLASETKVIPLEVKKTCAKVTNIEPMECNSTPGDSPAHSCVKVDEVMVESPINIKGNNCTMQVEVNSDDTASSSTTHMLVDSGNNSLVDEPTEFTADLKQGKELTYQDLSLLCDLFYLPFEHGGLGIHLLQEFNWLKVNASVLATKDKSVHDKTSEIEVWRRRAAGFNEMTNSVNVLFERLSYAANRELLYELYPYIWDLQVILSLLNSYIKWLACGAFTSLISSYIQGQYTWFSKGWKEAFMSGDQEPWVFRGGLTADLQRLLPVDSGMDLFMYRPPELPCMKLNTIRPYESSDREQIYKLCALSEGYENLSLFPDLPGDCRVGKFLEVHPDLCMVVEEGNDLIAYIAAVLDCNSFHQNLEQYFAKLASKYPTTADNLTDKEQKFLNEIHNFESNKVPIIPDKIHQNHPSQIGCFVSPRVSDESVGKRLLACVLGALRANGSFGVHTFLNKDDHPSLDWYSKLGFVEIPVDEPSSVIYIGRTF